MLSLHLVKFTLSRSGPSVHPFLGVNFTILFLECSCSTAWYISTNLDLANMRPGASLMHAKKTDSNYICYNISLRRSVTKASCGWKCKKFKLIDCNPVKLLILSHVSYLSLTMEWLAYSTFAIHSFSLSITHSHRVQFLSIPP